MEGTVAEETKSAQSPALVNIRPQTAMPAVQAVVAEPSASGPQHFQFTGTGSEYFRIWIVNLLLTVASLGIYSAWAKVRRVQYFYRNTRVAGSIFDYHGNPKAILKGRLLALILLAAYQISFDISPPLAIAIALLLVSIMPWLLASSFRFKLSNSSYRGVRFRFHGTVAQAYRMLILFPILLAVVGFFAWSIITTFSRNPGIGTLVLAGFVPLFVLAGTVPLAHFFLKKYQHDNGNFGQAPFFFHARAKDFFKIYLKALGCVFLGAIPAGIFGFLTAKLFGVLQSTIFGWLFALLYGALSSYAFFLIVRVYLESRIQNLVWNHTELGDMKFESTVKARRLFAIHASNLALIILTLGLYKPFATIRLIKYRVESMSLLPFDVLEDYETDSSEEKAGAIGQEAGDLFNIEVAL